MFILLYEELIGGWIREERRPKRVVDGWRFRGR